MVVRSCDVENFAVVRYMTAAIKSLFLLALNFRRVRDDEIYWFIIAFIFLLSVRVVFTEIYDLMIFDPVRIPF